MNATFQRSKRVFLELVSQAEPESWDERLAAACGNDQDLRHQVQVLLRAHQQPDTFLERAAIGIDASLKRSTINSDGGEQVGHQIGPYKLLEQIGEGGMGLVYMAQQQQPVRRLVALKLIKPGFDSKQTIARFEAEKQALAMMEHSNIARVLDAGTTETGRPYFVMELVRGIPINEFCDQKRLTVRERLELFVDVCRAVQHAHQKGIIHRDLKPTNVLVTMHDTVAVPKVIDFGIAKALGPQLTEHTLHTGFAQLVGTPLYMSPEQAEMNQLGVDTRSDIYSLGVMLYEVLTGTTPFHKETLSKAGLDEMRRMIREDEPPRPSARVSTLEAQALSTVSQRRSTDPRHISTALRGELDWIVMKALEKDRNHRYESASAFAADIQRYLGDEPVQACPPSVAYRLRKFVRRNQSRVMFAGLTTALFAVMAIGSVAAYSQCVTTQRQIAQDVSESLAAAKSAIEAGDLPLAEKRAAEAKGRLGNYRSNLRVTAADVDKLVIELDARRADQERFNKFMTLARDAQDKMGFNSDLATDRKAREALSLYGVLTEENWLARFDNSYLSGDQKREVQEVAYETLVSMADYGIRWRGGWENERQAPPMTVEQALEILDRAAKFHEPTRAFWFVRHEAHKSLKNDQAAAADEERFQTAVAKTAWDHYLPGHTADWRDNVAGAIDSYEAALRVQPDHYNSLFFLGLILQNKRPERMAEAAVFYTAAIALRPNQVAYRNRAGCYEKLKRLDAAEADYSAAIAVAATDDDQLLAYENRQAFYMRTGQPLQAQADLDRQVAIGAKLWQQRYGNLESADRATILSMHMLSNSYFASGNREQGLALALDAVKLAEVKLAPDHPDTLLFMCNAGNRCMEVGKTQEGLALKLATLERTKGKFGTEHRNTLHAMMLLAGAYLQTGRMAEGIHLHEETLALRSAKLGPDDRDTLNSMTNLALAYRDSGEFDKAVSLGRKVLDLRRGKQGPEDATTLNEMNNLGSICLSAGRADQSLELLKEAARLTRATLGPHHAYTFESHMFLPHAYLAAGQSQEALAQANASVELMKMTWGPHDPWTTNCEITLAEILEAVHDYPAAESVLRDILTRTRNKLRANDPWVIQLMAVLGSNLLLQHKYSEAEPLLREVLAVSEQIEPDRWTTFNRKSLVGGALLAAARDVKAPDQDSFNTKMSEAEPLLIAGYEGLKARETRIPAWSRIRVVQALERLIDLYTLWDKPAEAAQWQKELDSSSEK
jgi:eukaryotic-like serine/threonine-protein kinase